MSKCRIIDRLAYTRGEIKFIGEHEHAQVHEYTGDICPRCKQHTLRREARCAWCPACGYDACAWNEV